MTVQDDLDDLAARVDGLVAQVAIGYGEEPLADAVRSVLGLCANAYANGRGVVTCRDLRVAIREGLGS